MKTSYKKCSACSTSKPLKKGFSPNARHVDGFEGVCKTCRNKRQRENRRERLGGKIHCINASSDYEIDKSQYITSFCKICNVEFISRGHNQYLCKECAKPHRQMFGRLRYRKNRSGTVNIYIETSIETVLEITRRFVLSKTCAYCKRTYTQDNVKTVDHILPISCGGNSESDNINICCYECNITKSKFPLNKWLEICRLVSANEDLDDKQCQSVCNTHSSQ